MLEKERTQSPKGDVGGAGTKVGEKSGKDNIAKSRRENISNGNQWPPVSDVEEPKEVKNRLQNCYADLQKVSSHGREGAKASLLQWQCMDFTQAEEEE